MKSPTRVQKVKTFDLQTNRSPTLGGIKSTETSPNRLMSPLTRKSMNSILSVTMKIIEDALGDEYRAQRYVIRTLEKNEQKILPEFQSIRRLNL